MLCVYYLISNFFFFFFFFFFFCLCCTCMFISCSCKVDIFKNLMTVSGTALIVTKSWQYGDTCFTCL